MVREVKPPKGNSQPVFHTFGLGRRSVLTWAGPQPQKPQVPPPAVSKLVHNVWGSFFLRACNAACKVAELIGTLTWMETAVTCCTQGIVVLQVPNAYIADWRTGPLAYSLAYSTSPSIRQKSFPASPRDVRNGICDFCISLPGL